MFLNCDGWENFGYGKNNYEGTTDCSHIFLMELPPLQADMQLKNGHII